jgi:hypothetical protein
LSGTIADDDLRRRLLGSIYGGLVDEDARNRAREILVQLGMQAGADRSVEAWSRPDEEPVRLSERLEWIERELARTTEWRDIYPDTPHGDVMWRSVIVGLRIDRVMVLFDLDTETAIIEARAHLEQTLWPENMMSPSLAVSEDISERARLEIALGVCLIGRGDLDEADDLFASAIERLLSISDMWNLEDILASRVGRSVWRYDSILGKDCTDIAASMARLSGDAYGELVALDWILRAGSIDAKQCRRAIALLEMQTIDVKQATNLRRDFHAALVAMDAESQPRLD